MKMGKRVSVMTPVKRTPSPQPSRRRGEGDCKRPDSAAELDRGVDTPGSLISGKE
jgi:hypothetical protein